MQLVTKKELAEHFMVTPDIITEWINGGLPYLGEGDKVVYDLDRVKMWIMGPVKPIVDNTYEVIESAIVEKYIIGSGGTVIPAELGAEYREMLRVKGIGWPKVTEWLRSRGVISAVIREGNKTKRVFMNIKRR